jgi:GAF domain-containing protein
MAASSEEIRLVELFQVQNAQGPCLDCFAEGSTVTSGDLTTESRWPEFSAVCVSAGFGAVCAIPLRLEARVLGALNLFMERPIEFTEAQIHLARALADVATIAIVQGELARQSEVVQGQLEHALQSRIVIEQAKGMIAQRAGTDMDDAFSRLRSFARRNNRQLTEVARGLAEGVVDVDQVSSTAPVRHR